MTALTAALFNCLVHVFGTMLGEKNIVKYESMVIELEMITVVEWNNCII
jgi:hypothetical protein